MLCFQCKAKLALKFVNASEAQQTNTESIFGKRKRLLESKMLRNFVLNRERTDIYKK